MAQRSDMQQRTFTVVFMFAITFVTMSLVSGLRVATAKRVAVNESLFLRRAVMEAAGLPVPAEKEAILKWFEACAEPLSTSSGPPAFKISDPGKKDVEAYVFVGEGPGLWGRIRAAAGLDGQTRQFTGLAFLEQNETPGLGARIEEGWFKKQFRGKSGHLRLAPEGTRSGKADEVDAITGATITSKAVQDIMNAVQVRAAQMGGRPPDF